MASLTRSNQSVGRLTEGYMNVSLDDYRSDAEISSSRVASEPERDRVEKLRKTVEAEIIPRLMLLHAPLGQHAADELPSNDNAQVALNVPEFAEIVQHLDLSFARGYIDLLLEQGVALENIFLDLMAPTARHLGDLWQSDARSFAEVTIALGQLQQLLRSYSSSFEAEEGVDIGGCRMMLMPSRSDQHTFGLCMLDLFMRRAGCDVELSTRFELPITVRKLKTEWFDVIGVSAGSDVLLAELASDIRSLRRASVNCSVAVIVGGPAFVGHPERVARAGADGFAEDGQQAVHLVNRLMSKTSRC